MFRIQILILIFISFLHVPGRTQNKIGLNYYSHDTGRNLALSFNTSFAKHTFQIGIKYHLNRTPIDNQNHVFHKRFHAENFKEHLGIIAGYQYLIGKDPRKINALFFYDFQYLNASIRSYGFTSALLPGGGGRGFIRDEKKINTTTALENNIGVGFRIYLSEKISLLERIGVGINIFTNLDQNFFPFQNSSWEFGVLLGLSILYDL